MPTTVHVPKPLLDRVDALAAARGVSRNQVIVEALDRAVREPAEWSPALRALLAQPVDADVAAAWDEAMEAVRATRRSRKTSPL